MTTQKTLQTIAMVLVAVVVIFLMQFAAQSGVRSVCESSQYHPERQQHNPEFWFDSRIEQCEKLGVPLVLP